MNIIVFGNKIVYKDPKFEFFLIVHDFYIQFQ